MHTQVPKKEPCGENTVQEASQQRAPALYVFFSRHLWCCSILCTSASSLSPPINLKILPCLSHCFYHLPCSNNSQSQGNLSGIQKNFFTASAHISHYFAHRISALLPIMFTTVHRRALTLENITKSGVEFGEGEHGS